MTNIQHTQERVARTGAGMPVQAVLLFLIAGLFSLAYLDTFRELWHYWIEGYNWQFVVPLAFVYMLWDRKDLYEGLPREPSILTGLILLLAGCSLLVVGQLSSTHSLREISIIVNVFSLTFLLFGIAMFFLSILAMIPLMLGFLVLSPIAMITIYVAYREIFLEA